MPPFRYLALSRRPAGLLGRVALACLLLGALGCQTHRLTQRPSGQVDEQSPLLSWETFPDAEYRSLRPRITNVRYDLRIHQVLEVWPSRAEQIVREVYRRDGLRETTHAPEQPLEQGVPYRWSVRARFELDGRTRVTAWYGTHLTVRLRVEPLQPLGQAATAPIWVAEVRP